MRFVPVPQAAPASFVAFSGKIFAYEVPKFLTKGANA